MKTLFKWFVSIVFFVLSMSSCEKKQTEEPVYLAGDYYGEVIYENWLGEVEHKMNCRVNVIIDKDHYKFISLYFYLDNSVSIDFDYIEGSNVRGEKNTSERQGWVNIDGYTAKGTYKWEGENVAGFEISWNCSK